MSDIDLSSIVMIKRASLPLEGKAIRFAPCRDLEPAAWFWRVWTEGNEIYALTRNSGGVAKLSVHASGQIHYRLGPKHKQYLAPIMQFASSPWLHAFEIRFLMSEGAAAPPKQRESLRNKSAYVIPVPAGNFLVVNLIVGTAGTLSNGPLPAQFSGANVLWRARLPDHRLAVLIARMLELDDENRKKIEYYRKELKPTVTFPSTPREPYVEIHHLHWSPGGNVVLVVPMGHEAFRSEQEVIAPATTEGRRNFRYQSPHAATEIIAPNGLRVAVLELDERDQEIELGKNQPSTHELGILKMRLEASNLIEGSKFTASPCRVVCIPSIEGARPRDWTYTVYPRFDGFTLSAEIMQMSTSFQNKNFAVLLSQLSDREELVVRIPSENLKILATMNAPVTSAKVMGHFSLRDRR
jgi:hypothetical protein